MYYYVDIGCDIKPKFPAVFIIFAYRIMHANAQ